ncbi:hypothetical protein HZH66_013936 [Vespula vulgaris]|uniref:Uncharacterized protein n=1 Tax=Vespula vulgaris TaxID=7454 RepID=A0A834MQG6_VESVU|nr:uncharacterized protein LOC127071293 isoform X2 [Vespula vulgaris]KAF7381542.1 hypothetical protein HZH66_013936 [Vespula vulgaris]
MNKTLRLTHSQSTKERSLAWFPSTGVRVIISLRRECSHPSMGVTHASSLFVVLAVFLITVEGGDIIRKSIVFDKNTPDVFYCPQHKPTGFEKMIVKAKPLWRLCQFEGKPIPEDYKSDCYNDVDESEYACKEKYRIMKRIKNAEGDAKPIDNDYIEK